jgi:hypothetical protein
MAKNIGIIIVEKTGLLKELKIKDYKEEELFKKCGFKKSNDFEKRTEWSVKLDMKKYIVSVFGKTDGKANMENKYDFPPPIDNTLFFGNCAIVTQLLIDPKDRKLEYVSINLEQWEKIYEKLFGGFESLALTSIIDDEEIDELDNIPPEKKTKDGYLKDGFVVESDNDDEDYDTDTTSETNDNDVDVNNENEEQPELEIGSELSEEEYSEEE